MGGDLFLYRLKDRAAKVMNRGGYTEEIKPENFFDSKAEAISGIFDRLDRDICATCTKRIFLECGAPAPTSRRKPGSPDQTDITVEQDS